ncbi:MAG TPA: hypothetical protein VNO69_04845 [Methyloceanibacter sp.]|nr:hypothetical protein [Methyloceanibacter sp.]
MPTQLSQAEISIYAAVGYAQTKWADLEYTLCRVFREAVSPFAHEPSGAISADSPAEDAFWAIISFEGKLKMTNAAVERRLNSPSNHALLAEWAKASKRVRVKAAKRNQLAHGATFKENTAGGERVSFVPFLNQLMAGYLIVAGAPDAEISLWPGDIPPERDKWNVKRIESIAKGFEVGTLRLKRFYYALQAHNKAVSEQEAETRRFFEAHRKSHNSIKNPDPPQPSEA